MELAALLKGLSSQGRTTRTRGAHKKEGRTQIKGNKGDKLVDTVAPHHSPASEAHPSAGDHPDTGGPNLLILNVLN